ncbi:hypothetical protein D3C81_1779520 [compost metagenome]
MTMSNSDSSSVFRLANELRLSNSCGFGGKVPDPSTDKSTNDSTLVMASSWARPASTSDRPWRVWTAKISCWRGLRKLASTSRVRSPSCENTTARLAANRLAPSPDAPPSTTSALCPRANQRSMTWLRIARSVSTCGLNGS